MCEEEDRPLEIQNIYIDTHVLEKSPHLHCRQKIVKRTFSPVFKVYFWTVRHAAGILLYYMYIYPV